MENILVEWDGEGGRIPREDCPKANGSYTGGIFRWRGLGVGGWGGIPMENSLKAVGSYPGAVFRWRWMWGGGKGVPEKIVRRQWGITRGEFSVGVGEGGSPQELSLHTLQCSIGCDR